MVENRVEGQRCVELQNQYDVASKNNLFIVEE
jgi:hypothetical protein